MSNWVQGCEICNTGLCERMDALTSPVCNGGAGLSEREAAKLMEEEAAEKVGMKLWTRNHIRARYQYYRGWSGRKPATQSEHKQRVKRSDIVECPNCGHLWSLGEERGKRNGK